MPDDAIITVKDLTKAYRIWNNPAARLGSPLLETAAGLLPKDCGPRRALEHRATRHRRDFFALQGVTFSIRRGEATAIIGRNGSGKSTLLQLIAGTLTPTAGSVGVRGRVAALLELGSGFNPDFTGRENVYLNGSILGLSRAEVDARFAEIAAFADIGEFIEQPVKTYSSGMMVRLAFAVAVSVQPDILIVDEALSVGDVFFTQKCFRRIREIVHRGATLVFVSHDMASVQNLCDRALLLHAGRVAFDGAPEDCVSRYFSLHQPAAAPGGPAAVADAALPTVDAAARETLLMSSVVAGAKSRHGDKALEVLAAALLDGHGAATWDFEMMHRATLRVLVRANQSARLPSIGLQVHDRLGNLVFAAGTTQLRFALGAMPAGAEVMLDFRLALSLYPGVYTLSIDAAEQDAENPNIGHFHDRIGGLGPLTITHQGAGSLPFYGIAQLPLEISHV
jgi:ABC-type polysaccharide/polyol phosphate transport system ATPase subunit